MCTGAYYDMALGPAKREHNKTAFETVWKLKQWYCNISCPNYLKLLLEVLYTVHRGSARSPPMLYMRSVWRYPHQPWFPADLAQPIDCCGCLTWHLQHQQSLADPSDTHMEICQCQALSGPAYRHRLTETLGRWRPQLPGYHCWWTSWLPQLGEVSQGTDLRSWNGTPSRSQQAGSQLSKLVAKQDWPSWTRLDCPAHKHTNSVKLEK